MLSNRLVQVAFPNYGVVYIYIFLCGYDILFNISEFNEPISTLNFSHIFEQETGHDKSFRMFQAVECGNPPLLESGSECSPTQVGFRETACGGAYYVNLPHCLCNNVMRTVEGLLEFFSRGVQGCQRQNYSNTVQALHSSLWSLIHYQPSLVFPVPNPLWG